MQCPLRHASRAPFWFVVPRKIFQPSFKKCAEVWSDGNLDDDSDTDGLQIVDEQLSEPEEGNGLAGYRSHSVSSNQVTVVRSSMLRMPNRVKNVWKCL
jgi:hypothetical protein